MWVTHVLLKFSILENLTLKVFVWTEIIIKIFNNYIKMVFTIRKYFNLKPNLFSNILFIFEEITFFKLKIFVYIVFSSTWIIGVLRITN